MGKRGDNEGSVFQRKSTGKWVALVFLGYRPDGKRDYKTYTYATRREAPERLTCPRWQDWNLIFPSTVGTPLDSQNLTKRFKALLAKADLPDMRFHDLRHSCATLLFAQGVPLGMAQRTLGHSQVNLTMNTHVHIFPEVQKQAADAMERLLGGARTRVG